MDKVELNHHGTVGVITLNRPETANALDLEMAQQFQSAAEQCASKRVRAVVVTGAGKNFCFGGDLRAMASSGSDRIGYLRRLTHHLHQGIAVLARLNAPVIAAVNGTAAGAGIGLLAMADLAYCDTSSKFRLAYSGVALTPDAGTTYLLPRLIGSRRTLEWLLFNRVVAAEEALAWGLVNSLYDPDDLLRKSLSIAQTLASGPAEAFATGKRLIGQALIGLETQLGLEGEAVSRQAASAEGNEGITAFLEKRVARYVDEPQAEAD